MSKRSTNLKNLLEQKSRLEVKIYELQRQLDGVEKSISKVENLKNADSKESSSGSTSEIQGF